MRPGAPTTFTFDEAYVLSVLGVLGNINLGLAGIFLLSAMGLPSDPQNTAAYVAVEPEGELPTAADWVKLAFPPIAAITGTYTRLGNWVKLQKWNELALCNGSPEIPPEGDYTYLCTIEHVCTDSSGVVLYVCGPYSGYDYYRCTLTSGANLSALGIQVQLQRGLVFVNDSYASTLANAQATAALTAVDQYVDLAVNEEVSIDNTFYVFSTCGGGPYDPAPEGFITIYGHRDPDPPTEPELPEPVVPGGCPDIEDFADLSEAICNIGKQLDRIEAKVDWLASITPPPQVIPDDEPTVPEPVDPEPPPEGQPVPLQPILRPAGATGVIVELTTIPAWQAQHGTNPKFWPALGHIALMTDYGPLPSILIKHNPMVLLSIPPQVVALQLDLAPGVVGQVRFLNQPK